MIMRPQNPVAFLQAPSNDNSGIFSTRIVDSQRPSKLHVYPDNSLYPSSKLLQPKLLPISPLLQPNKKAQLGSSSSHPLLPQLPFQLDQSNNYYADHHQPSPSLRFARHHATPTSAQIPKLNLEQFNSEFTPRQHSKSFSLKTLEPTPFSANRFEVHLEKQNKVLTQLMGMISKQEQIANIKHEKETQRILKELHEEKLQVDLRLEKEISKRNQELLEKKLPYKPLKKDNSATQELLYDLLLHKIAPPPQNEDASFFKSPRLSSKRLSQLEYSPAISKTATTNSGNFSSESIDSFDEKPSRFLRNSISRSREEVSEPVHLFADDGLVEIVPRVKSKTVLKKEGSYRNKNAGRRVTFGGNDTITFEGSN